MIISEIITKDDRELVYTRSEWMAVDIYAKAFTNKDNWHRACELANVMDPANLEDVIRRRAQIFESLRNDHKWHSIKKKPQDRISSTHRKWMEGQKQWLASSTKKG